MGIRWSVDPKATRRIRFDDADFLAALEADASKEERPLAKLIGVGVEQATDADYSEFTDAGAWLDVRLGITASEEDQLQNYAQQDDARKGIKLDVDRHNRKWFATWVIAVGAESGTQPPAGLSATRKSDREEAIGSVPADVRGLMFARLRAYTDHANRPAMRDPLQSRLTADSGMEA